MMNPSAISTQPATTSTPSGLEYKHLHFIGVGGVGMSAIALGALHAGIVVSGSDLNSSRYTECLKSAGARILVGHNADNLGDADAVVVSTAIRETNPEMAEARRRGLPVLHRSEVLAALLAPHKTICVAGSHGKTTTTAMIGCCLEGCGLDPSVYVGGFVEQYGCNARLGNGEYVVAEADESDGSFLRLPTDFAVVNNIEPEHLDYWGDGDQLIIGFRRFLKNIRPGGYAIVNNDDPGVLKVLAGLGIPVLTSSVRSEQANYAARNIELLPFGSEFDFLYEGKRMGRVRLIVPGIHNVSNATTAIGLTLGLGGDFDRIVSALAHFHGVGRRFQIVGNEKGILVVDDYAHHPTEVAATLRAGHEAARSRGGRLIGVFQPHRFTRTQTHLQEFGAVFGDCDEAIITEIYAAGENPIEGIDGSMVRKAIADAGHNSATFVASCDDVIDYLLPRLREGDLVMTIGAGDVYKVGKHLLEALASSSVLPAPAAPADHPVPEV